MNKIKFNIPQSVNTKVIIYDILGKEVTVPLKDMLKPGEYEINFDSVNLPAGTYFYKVIIDGFTETKKMTVAK